MAIKYGFFNSVNGDRKYTAADIGDFLQGLIASGVYHDSSTSLQVLAAGGMTVEVQPGRAMLNFKKLENDAPHGLTLTAGGTMDRIDAIVAYMDLNERVCGIIVKEGTPAAAPAAPAMTRTDVRYEIMLASVYVTRLTNEITQSKITDTRANTSVCGWVCGIIDQVDTATLFTQWQTAYEEAYAELGDYLAAQKAAWEAFFADVTADNVLPTPSLDDAGKFLTINEAGDGYELQSTDTSLSTTGRAADAAATGAALEGKAPSGYGLGAPTGMFVNTDCNTATSNGWYYVTGAANAAHQYDHAMLVVGYGRNALTQIAFLGTAYSAMTYILIRKCVAGTWHEWEWLNPKLEVGVEYRTTERWNSTPVYVKVVDCGLSIDGTKTLEGVISGKQCIRVDAILGGWALPSEVQFANQTHQYFGYVTSNGTDVYVHCSNGWKGVQVYAAVYYTKV